MLIICFYDNIKVILINAYNKKIESFEEYIRDDGVITWEENIEADWHDDYVEIVLIGGEQEDDTYQLKYK